MSGALRPRSDPAVDFSILFHNIENSRAGCKYLYIHFCILCLCVWVLESLDWVEVYWWSLQAWECLNISKENQGDGLNTLASSSFCWITKTSNNAHKERL